ncbi:MAG TPA: cold-shock protein [Anaerohalosphaeraceae bacterium]|nr:cold-shock protein [Anaerohalosphaeraceae bacterium]
MPKGTVKWFDYRKGFGFVVNEEGLDVFVHFSNIQCDGFRTLRPGQTVEYAELKSPKGLQGKEVQVVAPLISEDKTTNQNQ